MLVTFVYQPKSGDRVVADATHSTVEDPPLHRDILSIRYPNGCRHVIGGLMLSYQTANPGEHWRGAAKHVASQIAQATGGIAWDDQGTVSLVVPLWAAWETDRTMRLTRGISTGLRHAAEDDENRLRMVLHGAARIHANTEGDAFGIAPVRPAGRQPLRWVHPGRAIAIPPEDDDEDRRTRYMYVFREAREGAEQESVIAPWIADGWEHWT